MTSENLISKAFLVEINRLVNLKELQLGATIMWIFNYAKNTNTEIPNLDGLSYLLGRINRAMKIMYPNDRDDYDSSDESLQSNKNDGSDGNVTEPFIVTFN
jgi:hypothetical protein